MVEHYCEACVPAGLLRNATGKDGWILEKGLVLFCSSEDTCKTKVARRDKKQEDE